MTSLLGRLARGHYRMTFDHATGEWSWAVVEGEIVGAWCVPNSSDTIWILNVDGIIRACSREHVVVLPRAHREMVREDPVVGARP